MHEIGIMDDILSAISAKLRDKKEISKVKSVNISIGELEHISPEHFEFHFRERTKSSLLKNAKLNFKTVEARFRCKDCSTEFKGQEGLKGCPRCKSNVNDVISGIGINVDSVEIV